MTTKASERYAQRKRPSFGRVANGSHVAAPDADRNRGEYRYACRIENELVDKIDVALQKL